MFCWDGFPTRIESKRRRTKDPQLEFCFPDLPIHDSPHQTQKKSEPRYGSKDTLGFRISRNEGKRKKKSDYLVNPHAANDHCVADRATQNTQHCQNHVRYGNCWVFDHKIWMNEICVICETILHSQVRNIHLPWVRGAELRRKDLEIHVRPYGGAQERSCCVVPRQKRDKVAWYHITNDTTKQTLRIRLPHQICFSISVCKHSAQYWCVHKIPSALWWYWPPSSSPDTLFLVTRPL